MKTLKEIRLKSGTVIPAGTECTVAFVNSPVALVTPSIPDAKAIRFPCATLPRYFAKFKTPSMAKLERASDEGICPSVMGERVEPDGYDSHGSPSWLIALGMI